MRSARGLGDCNYNHDWDNNGIACTSRQLRHILEIHSIDICKECQGHENYGNDREYLHPTIKLMLGHAEVAIGEIGRDLIVQNGKALRALYLLVEFDDLMRQSCAY